MTNFPLSGGYYRYTITNFFADSPIGFVSNTPTVLYAAFIPSNTVTANGQSIYGEFFVTNALFGTATGAMTNAITFGGFGLTNTFNTINSLGIWDIRVIITQTGTSSARAVMASLWSNSGSTGLAFASTFQVAGYAAYDWTSVNWATNNYLKLVSSQQVTNALICAKQGKIEFVP